MRQLNRLLLITLSLSRHTVSTGPATSCVNRKFLSPAVVSVLSGYAITLRISKALKEKVARDGIELTDSQIAALVAFLLRYSAFMFPLQS